MAGRRENLLDPLRIAAALFIVIGHNSAIFGAPPIKVLNIDLSALGLVILFVVSGYLVTISAEVQNSRHYWKRRCVRIFPGLLAYIMIAVFVIGPVFTKLTLFEYFTNLTTYKYLLNSILITNHLLPGVFEFNLYPYSVNGSLWSLPIEFIGYFTSFFILLLQKRIGSKVFTFPFLILISFTAITIANSIDGRWSTAWTVLGSYSLGATWAILKSRSHKICFLSLLFFIHLFIYNNGVIFIVFLTLIVTLIKTSIWINIKSLIGDPSYGIYLYGFIVSQSLITLEIRSVPVLHILSIFLSISFGLLSWYLIEERIIKFVTNSH